MTFIVRPLQWQHYFTWVYSVVVQRWAPIVSVILGKSKRPVWIQQPYWSSTSKRVVFFKTAESLLLRERQFCHYDSHVGQDEETGEEWGAVCVAMFGISVPRWLHANPWRLLPYPGNTSFFQSDRRDDSSSLNYQNWEFNFRTPLESPLPFRYLISLKLSSQKKAPAWP